VHQVGNQHVVTSLYLMFLDAFNSPNTLHK